MELATLIDAVRPLRVVGEPDADILAVTYDARSAVPGALHVCVPGLRADGHDFAPVAVGHGAVALIVERELDLPVTQLVVESSRQAMAAAADAFYGHPSDEVQVVGVTGTNGKTTTAYLMHAILSAAGLRPGLLGTVESRIGGVVEPVTRTTPESVDLQAILRRMADAGDRSCAMEVSSHALELRRADSLRFAAVAFTNLTPDHLEFHPDMEAYYMAKLRLDLRLRGHFNGENVLCAVAVAELLDLPHYVVREGIAAMPGVPGRFEAVDAGQSFTVLVDYAHTPDSLENVLRSARAITAGRLICVFGCGGDRDRGKRPLMGTVARKLADRAIVTTDNSRSEDPQAIADEITAGIEMEVELDRRRAIEDAVAGAGAGDVVVIAGKGHEQGQQFADRTIPFDDREVARAALEA